MDDRERAVAALNLIAAKAKKTADDLEHNRIWEGELQAATHEISRQMSDVSAYAQRRP